MQMCYTSVDEFTECIYILQITPTNQILGIITSKCLCGIKYFFLSNIQISFKIQDILQYKLPATFLHI